MGNIGSSRRRFDVLPLGRLTVESVTGPTRPAHATDPSPGVPAPEPMPAPYPEPTPEPSPLPDPHAVSAHRAASSTR